MTAATATDLHSATCLAANKERFTGRTGGIFGGRVPGSGVAIRPFSSNTQDASSPFFFPLELAIDDLDLVVEGTAVRIAGIKKNDQATELQQISTLSHVIELDAIKAAYGVSMTQLAQLLGVTRKAVYDWYEGTEPRANIRNSLAALNLLASKYTSRTDLQMLKHYWAIPLNGESLLNVIARKSSDAESLNIELEKKLTEIMPRIKARIDNSRLKTSTGAINSHVADLERIA